MRGLSKRVKTMKPSSTVAVNAKALELRRQGVDLIAMTAGEPDFDTPQFVKDAAARAMAAGKTKYAPPAGIPELREAISAKFKRENGLDIPPDQTVVTVGGKQALFNLFQAILDPGDEVIVIGPYWVSYPEMVRFAEGVPVEVNTGPESGFIPDPAEIERRITPRTKAIVVNSPGNPTGAVYPKEVLAAIAELANKHDCYIVSDEIYEHLIYEGEHFSPAHVAPDRTITVNGAAKAFAMTGWRIGYAGGPKDVIKGIIDVSSQSTTSPDTIAQWAMVEALNNVEEAQKFISMAREAYRARRGIIVDGLNALGLPTPKVSGAFYVLSDVSKIDPDENRAALKLLNEARVAVVPGTDFAAPHHVRFSYATSEENIRKALERIASIL
ncbi:pyridoxal phosphate-dependent aminotransferase [Meiothermus taiwanensis]|jgi:aspartate aminotransferase|uniref:Aminotransferase n=2 Tax=Meiothermus taiwanensis TaxID=172827 RepID=A0A399DQZ7_9DEIN|nr:pyridoxal phosphate-dependent aminotransferase [Meiothermus taiwanensis]AWR87256.1 aminotransferase class I and II [Meiothermus taiwanensis WR-220]KIQ53439.1 aspartate aminotransferase [Meiothermus taiwanensis]KZK16880.1 aspartate aminotransferase [Meiothermus taiwanensis]RIH74665.1 Aspartate aminotransferase [Meiothermus taiwanensis]